ncbi:MAG: hypothetical protein KDD06_21225 [Phaeodactylibacter sp.]|nr:hypothetical protein [Phaeodactylibacter sp.]MCB9264140.1 hypothetical protein [Lewinellaceae bacterium]MCB9286760.1 hypothetical protein [Lewinellaceae bacterium]
MKKITLLLWMGVASCSLFAQTVTTIAANIPIDDDLIVDAEGNIIGSHYSGTALRRLTLGGESEVFITGFNTPNGLAYDAQGQLFMADNQGNKVYKVAPDGSYELFAELTSPSGLLREWDSDTLIATSYTGDKIVKIAPDGSIADFLTDSRFNGPVGLCYDEMHNLYIANFDDRRIFKWTPEGGLSDFSHPGPNGWLGFIAYAHGYIYATLFSRNQIWRIDSAGLAEQWLGSSAGSVDGDASVAKFNRPNGIRPSVTGDTLFVSDFQTRSVRMITNLDAVTPSREELKTDFNLSVSPNPATASASARFFLPDAMAASLQLLDNQGRLVRKTFTNEQLPGGWYEYPLPVGALPNGTYYCELWGRPGRIAVAQFVLSR